MVLLPQILLSLWFSITHWIPLPPLNDLTKEAFEGERKMNLIMNVMQFFSIIGYLQEIFILEVVGLIFWTVWMYGHIMSWWLPYYFGWPKAFLEGAEEDNERTIHFLPKRGNHPIPDVVHCVLGALSLWTFISLWCYWI